MSKNYMSRNDELRRGDSLMSNNRQWKAVFQDDGNFVVYGWKPVWASNTDGSDGLRLCLQADSNLVMYSSDAPIWATNTGGTEYKMSHLQLTNDGILVLSREGDEIWRSTYVKEKK